jgi:hypothetical protein
MVSVAVAKSKHRTATPDAANRFPMASKGLSRLASALAVSNWTRRISAIARTISRSSILCAVEPVGGVDE